MQLYHVFSFKTFKLLKQFILRTLVPYTGSRVDLDATGPGNDLETGSASDGVTSWARCWASGCAGPGAVSSRALSVCSAPSGCAGHHQDLVAWAPAGRRRLLVNPHL